MFALTSSLPYKLSACTFHLYLLCVVEKWWSRASHCCPGGDDGVTADENEGKGEGEGERGSRRDQTDT